eukprot:scaffold11783_cov120-Cylindrotheca_fusiformis.AAC.4
MTMKSGCIVVLLVFVGFGANQAGILDCFKCPTSDNYSDECLQHVLPPWPICLANNAEYFVEKAKGSAPRCCTGDLSECHCPKKDSPKFLNRIDDYCSRVQKCMPCEDRDCLKQAGTTEVMDRKYDIRDYQDYHGQGFHGYHGDHALRMESSKGNCPTDESYSTKCLESAIPPYPICLKASAKEWVEKSIKGHDDCCGEDLSTCKCPEKESAKFISKIGDWCAGVETCSSAIDNIEAAGNLRTESKLLSP